MARYESKNARRARLANKREYDKWGFIRRQCKVVAKQCGEYFREWLHSPSWTDQIFPVTRIEEVA